MSEMAEQRVTFHIEGMESVPVRADVRYASSGSELSLDAYMPPGVPSGAGATRPAVVFVSGYPDPGFEKVVGCKFKDMGAYVSWAQLIASSGMVAITYENVSPVDDLSKVIKFVQNSSGSLGVDPNRIGLWACSGNVPAALALLSDLAIAVACAALCYGYTMDLDGGTEVAEASSRFGFVDAMSGKNIDDLSDAPLLLVRAGLDEMPNLNRCLDRFVGGALERNLPVTLINYPQGVHAFDLSDNSAAAKAVVERILSYLCRELRVDASSAVAQD